MTQNSSHTSSALPDGFLARLVFELDNDNVTALALIGSYARGNATLYSDIDVLRFVREVPERTKQYLYREGRLIGISTRTPEQYRKRFSAPEEAIFVIPGIREARVLLDKEGEFARLQEEARNWIWEPLQVAANWYAGEVMMVQTEIVHKVLRALLVQDHPALAEMILLIFSAITDALTVQRGIIAESGNTYFQQIEDAIGQDTNWTRYHRLIAGIDTYGESAPSLRSKGITSLYLYRETAQMLRSHLNPLHRDVIEQAVEIINQVLSTKEIF